MTSAAIPQVLLVCSHERYYGSQFMLASHSLVRVITGEMKVLLKDQELVIGPGGTWFGPRYQLFKTIKYPLDGLPYRAISISFDQAFLLEQYGDRRQHITPVPAQLRLLAPHPLFDSLFGSLAPYFENAEPLTADLMRHKMAEAFLILRGLYPELDAVLADFAEPGKVDLKAFMESHYMFNIGLEQFGRMSGRSLTSFKRDFWQTYQDTPQRWLTRRRLELARSLMEEQNRSPSDVYYEAGFENLSHFSFAFKKHFGYPPSRMAALVS